MKSSIFTNDTEGVSPIISAILLLTIMLITVGAIMAWAIPQIQQMEYSAQYEGVYSNFEVFDTRADDVIYGGPDNSRTTGFSVGGGDLLLAQDDGYILVYWSLIPENVTFTKVSFSMKMVEDEEQWESTFSFIFDSLDGDNLTVNITGSGGNWRNRSAASSEDHDFIPDSIMGTVTPDFNFGDFQYIRIHNSTMDLAEAYFFRMRVLEHQLPTNQGYYEIKWMNGAIITNRGSSQGSVSDIPYVYPKDDHLSLNMINLTANNSGFHSAGKGSYEIHIRNRGVDLLEDKRVFSFHMDIHTEYTRGWNSYYSLHRGFSKVKDSTYADIGLSYKYGEYVNLKLVRTDLEITGVI